MVKIERVMNCIVVSDGDKFVLIPFWELDGFDNKFYKMKRDIEKDQRRIEGAVIDGGVSHPTKTIEAQLAEIEADQ